MVIERKTKISLEKKHSFVPQSVVGMEIAHGQDKYKLVRYLPAQGKRGYTYEAFCQGTDHRICCKLYYKEMLDEIAGWDQEFTKVNRVQSDHIAKYITHGECEFSNIKFCWIYYQWITGATLKEFINTHPDRVNIAFVRLFAEWILAPLSDLNKTKPPSRHGDIHSGNIMVSTTTPDDVPPNQTSFILIDFGISSSRLGLTQRNDYEAVAAVISYLFTRIRKGELTGKDRFYYDRLSSDFIKLLNEGDSSRDEAVGVPRKLYDVLQEIGKGSEELETKDTGKLDKLPSPFEIVNAERFSEDSPLIRQLFAKLIPGYSDLEAAETIVLTGPRGCGKTMIFRNMATRTFLSANNLSASEFPKYIGFYLSYFELWSVFPKRKIDEQKSHKDIATDDFQRKVLHYFHLCVLVEIFDTLELLEKRYGELFALPNQINSLAEFINLRFHPYQKSPVKNLLADLKLTCENWRSKIKRNNYSYMRDSSEEICKEGPAFLRDFCKCMKENIPFLRNKRILFLLDDYSLGKLTAAVQFSLNRVIFQRVPEFEFKISAEKEAILLEDGDGPIEPGRSYSEIDLGYSFAAPDTTSEKIRFLSEVFNNRLRSSEGVVYTDITQILGSTRYKSQNQFANVLAGREPILQSSDEILKKPYYHGLDHLAEICSGDIAAMIVQVRKIISRGNFDLSKLGQKIITAPIQDEAIKDYSRLFLEQMGGEQKLSSETRLITKAVGELAKWKLENQTSTNEGIKCPFQVGRFEVYEDSAIDDATEKLFKHLLRYGVFIQVPRGFSEDETPSRRLYFRRLFFPIFGLSFSRRDCIRLHMKDFVQLLKHPEQTKEEFKKRWGNRLKETNQPKLFGNNTEETLNESEHEFD